MTKIKGGEITLQDRVKSLSDIETHRAFPPHVPIIVTLQGRDLFEDPTTLEFHDAMCITGWALGQEARAVFVHVVGEHITLVLGPHNPEGSQAYRGGVIQKIITNVSSRASVIFDRLLGSPTGGGERYLPGFDVSAWSVFVEEDVVDHFQWVLSTRRSSVLQDLTRGKVPSKSKNEVRDAYLQAQGTPFSDLRAWYRQGTFSHRKTVTAPYTPKELEQLPEQHHAHRTPGASFTRDVLEMVSMECYPFPRNLRDVMFRGATPV